MDKRGKLVPHSKESWGHNCVYILLCNHASQQIKARVLSYLYYKIQHNANSTYFWQCKSLYTFPNYKATLTYIWEKLSYSVWGQKKSKCLWSLLASFLASPSYFLLFVIGKVEMNKNQLLLLSTPTSIIIIILHSSWEIHFCMSD